MNELREIPVRAIDLERLGVCITFINTDSAARKDVARKNALLIAAADDMLSALRRAVLALAFAAESSAAMHDDYQVVSDAIARATHQE